MDVPSFTKTHQYGVANWAGSGFTVRNEESSEGSQPQEGSVPADSE